MKSYLINLDRSPERLAYFTAQADAAGLAFERVAAVDGRNFAPGDLARLTSPAFQFQPVSAAEAAVFLSHRACWRRLVDSGAAWAAVFEDDVALAPRTGSFLDRVEAETIEASIIKLETTGRRIVVGPPYAAAPNGIALRPLLTWHGGMAAYAISRDTAIHLLGSTTHPADPVDQVVFHPASFLCRTLAILQAIPALAMQHDFLHPDVRDPAFATTIGRPKKGLFRHGMFTDLRRALIKHRERRQRSRLAKMPGNQILVVPFAASPSTESDNG